MEISREKLDIIQRVIALDDQETLHQIHNLLNRDEIIQEMSESEMQSIERGLRDLEEGRKISYQELKTRLSEWVSS